MSSKNMHKSELLPDVIKRIKDIKNLKSDAQVAKELNMTRNNLYGFKRRKKIPNDALQIFCSREKIRLDYIINGTLPIYENQTGLGDMYVKTIFNEQKTAVNDNTTDLATKKSGLIAKAIDILDSNSIYGAILSNSIETLYEAVSCNDDLTIANKKIENLEKEIIILKQRLPAVGA